MKHWKFSELVYGRLDYDNLKEEVQHLTKELEEVTSFEEAEAVTKKAFRIYKEVGLMETLAHIRHTLNTNDRFYEEEVKFIKTVAPTLMPYHIAYADALNNSRFKSDFMSKYGKQMFVDIELQKKSFCEENIPLSQKEGLLTNEYQKIMASCKIELDGKVLNLYGIQKYFEDGDRAVRKKAAKAFSDFYRDNEKRLDEIWGELIRVRNEMGKNLGYKNFIPIGYMRQGRTDYGQAEVESFRKQVKDYIVPLCEKLYEAQAKRIGVDEIYFYDEKMVFSDGNATPIGDDDFMIEKSREMYHKMSPETAEFIDFMIEHELLDLKNKNGKAATGYMTMLTKFKAPFVFSCFNGTIFDMQVLTHELGHAFAGYLSMRAQEIPNYYMPSTDIAEIHSMAMEQFTYEYAEKFFGEEADKYRFQHLMEAMTFVPFGVAVDEFQHICYENPNLTPLERTAEWKKLEEKYMPWRKYDEADDFMNRGGYWHYKLHIYLYPFYYINYTLTTVGAMEFKKKYAKDREKAWADYLKLCKVGGSRSYLEILKYADVSNPFEEGSVEKACSYAADILLKEAEILSKA